MIGLRNLSNNRLELYASRFPLDILKPYLLDYYREAYVTIVLYEDNIEVYHETGIFSFDASEPETFNYEEFKAPLIEEFHDRMAICTVESLFTHFQRYMEDKPLEDDPFQNIVFSISLVPPSRDILMEWEKNIDKHLRQVLYDVKSSEHFQLFPNEVCVVYSHDNYFTSVTSDQEDLIRAVFEDVLEKHMAPICDPPLPIELTNELYGHIKTYGCIQINPDRICNDSEGNVSMLVAYPGHSTRFSKLVSRIQLDETGIPVDISDTQYISRLQYYLRYSDFSLLPMILLAGLMIIAICFGLYFRIIFT